MKLKETQIKSAKPKEKSYKMYDGNGLYLEVRTTGKKYWRLRYKINNREKTYTIGTYPQFTLKKAREEAFKLKLTLKNFPTQNSKLLKDVINEFLDLKKKGWSEVYYKKQLRRIEIYILPFLGNREIRSITKSEIVEIIKNVSKIVTPTTKVSNKSEVTKRIYLILRQIYTFSLHNDYVDVNILDKIDINNLITKEEVKHFDAITNIEELRKLYKDIQSYPSINKFALQFLALTALRPGNIQNLKWEYIDWDKKTINFPAEVMKIRKDYRLPLTKGLIHILEEMKKFSLPINIYVFCSPVNFAKRMSENSLNQAIKKMGYNHRAHGWRASFSTLCYEHQKEHGFSSEIIETQLAHSVGNKVTRAYMRSDFLEERRELLEWWEEFLNN